jgi:hypothetical protein
MEHTFDKTKNACSCGWTNPHSGNGGDRERAWQHHLDQARLDERRDKRLDAVVTLRSLANSLGNQTNPTEDVIDLARAVLVLFGEDV